jgi:epoxyqueuosine reductase
MKSLLHISDIELKSLGVLDWGYTENPIPESYSNYLDWVELNHSGALTYLSDERKDLRSDLREIYPEFKSALVFLFSYQETKKWMLEHQRHEVAAYALGFDGLDYHFELKKRLETIFKLLAAKNQSLEYSLSLDVQPVLERDLAYRAGLGWFGKNSMLINRKEGSYFIIGSILLNQTLDLELPVLDVDHCGQCSKCIEACPTNAINGETRTLEASKCISTYTIETFKDVDPPIGLEKSRGEYFGCDICQDVCPWNSKPLMKVRSVLNLKEEFNFLKKWFYDFNLSQLHLTLSNMTNRGLKKQLKFTAFDRPGKVGWLKNLKVWLKSSTENDS